MEKFQSSEERAADNFKYVFASIVGALLVAMLNYGKIIDWNWTVLEYFSHTNVAAPLVLNFLGAPVLAAVFVRNYSIRDAFGAFCVGAGTVGLLQILFVSADPKVTF